MVQRVLDRFLRLNLAQKMVAIFFAALLLFSAAFLISTAVFRSMGGGSERANTPSEQSGGPATSHNTGSTNPQRRSPDVSLKISSARWDGQKAVVEGTWGGAEVSSVHCDLFEGAGTTRWWDRAVGTQMDWMGQTFTQEFVSARGSEGWEPLDPLASYNVTCSAWFAGGIGTTASAPVKGKPTD